MCTSNSQVQSYTASQMRGILALIEKRPLFHLFLCLTSKVCGERLLLTVAANCSTCLTNIKTREKEEKEQVPNIVSSA